MATRRAVANGSWSSPGTWDGGTSIPGNGDTVYANGWNVTIDQNINIGGNNNPTVNAGSFVSGQWYEITFVGTTSFPGAPANTVGIIFLATGAGTGTGTAKAIATITTALNAAAGAASGGQFSISATYNMTCDIRAGTTICLNVTGSAALSLNGLRILGGSSANAHGINNAGTSPIAITGCSILGPANNNSSLLNASSATITISTGTTISGGANNGAGITNAANGIISLTGSIISGPFQSTPGFAISNLSGGGVIINSSIITGGDRVASVSNATSGYVTLNGCTLNGAGNVGVGGFAVVNSGLGTITATSCDFTSNAFSNAISGTNINANVSLSGNFYDHWQGIPAVAVTKWKLGTSPALGQHRFALSGTTDSYFTMYGADNGSFGNPIAANVRSGVSYGGGNLTGTCAVPAAGSVALGVPIDNTPGTAVLTPANVQSALTEQGITTARAGNLDNLDATISSRLSPSGTLATVTTLTNAPTSVTPSDIWSHSSRTLTSASGPTAVQIRQEIDANSTKLDAAISTRLAGSAYTAPANSDITAIKAKTDNLPAAPAAVSNIPTAAQNASATRSELSVELARVDQAISTRATPANIPTADITAIKAKTDALPASPAATGDIPSANIAAIKAKTDLLNTDRLAQVSTVSTTGAQLAAALS